MTKSIASNQKNKSKDKYNLQYEDIIFIPSKEEVTDFIMHIQALNISKILNYISKYGNNITNRIQFQSRMSCVYFVVREMDFNMASFILRQFIKCNTNLKAKDLYNNNLLFYVCSKQRFRMFKYLLYLGLNINQVNIYGQSIIHQLVKNQQIEILRYLQQSKLIIDVNLQDQFKKTPIFYAADHEYYQICQILINMGALIGIYDFKHHTPLYYAKKKLKTDISDLLQRAKKQQMKKLNNTPVKIKQQQSSNDSSELTSQATSIYKIKHQKKNNAKSLSKKHSKNVSRSKSDLNRHNLRKQLSNDWKNKARRILTELYKKQFSELFKNPVDQGVYGINDYYSSIKNPMDLGKISSKLKNNEYNMLNQFINDIYLLVDNCVLYNGYGHFVTAQVFKLKDYVDDQYL